MLQHYTNLHLAEKISTQPDGNTMDDVSPANSLSQEAEKDFLDLFAPIMDEMTKEAKAEIDRFDAAARDSRSSHTQHLPQRVGCVVVW